MKAILKVTILIILFALVLSACSTSDKKLTAPKSVFQSQLNQLRAAPSDPDTFAILAGQYIHAGTMSLWNDADNICVRFDLTGGWLMAESHVQVATDLSGIPVTNSGNPIPGQFTYHTTHNPYVTTYTYTIPIADYPFAVGDTIVVAAHCSLLLPDGNGGYQQETGWGAGIPGPTGERWWYYMKYVITEEEPPPPPPVVYQYETAMMRMNDVANDFTYRWMMGNGKPHAWFSYVKTTPDATPQTYYFYAGRSFKCGEVQIWKDGSNLKVQVNTINDWFMSISHLNIQLTDFVGSPAFGLFPHHMTYDPITGTDTYTIPWDSSWDGQLLRIALHADVQRIMP